MSVKIKLDDNHYLRSDALQWKISRLKGIDKNGDESWDTRGFYNSPHSALEGFAREVLRRSDATTLSTLLATALKLRETLLEHHTVAKLITQSTNFKQEK